MSLYPSLFGWVELPDATDRWVSDDRRPAGGRASDGVRVRRLPAGRRGRR